MIWAIRRRDQQKKHIDGVTVEAGKIDAVPANPYRGDRLFDSWVLRVRNGHSPADPGAAQFLTFQDRIHDTLVVVLRDPTSIQEGLARHVTVVDLVEKFLKENRGATAHFNIASYCCADVMDLEFEDGSFDFVFMNWLLMYLDDRQITLLRDRIRRWTRVGGYVFFRESCFVGSTGTAPSKDNPTRYRSDEEYTRLFEKDFSLLHRGNVKIYDELFNNPHQHYWLFQR